MIRHRGSAVTGSQAVRFERPGASSRVERRIAASLPADSAGAFTLLTLEDCVGLSDLTRAEIDAIAEHEHLPELIAAELGNYLVHTAKGRRAIKDIIRDDIVAAQWRRNFRESAKLKLVLRHFIDRCRSDPALNCC